MTYRLTEYQTTKEALPYDFDVLGFKAYLDDVWRSRFAFYETQTENYSKKQPFLSFEYAGPKCGPRLTSDKYVGFVQYNGVTIEILPKIFEPEQSGVAFRHLLWWLYYCRNIRFPFTELLRGSEVIDDFPEALIGYFARYTLDLISRQPYYQYEEKTEAMSFLRGQLNTAAYVRESLSRGNLHQLVCDHAPFVHDNRLNQIIKYVSRKLSGLCRFADTHRRLGQLLFALDEVSDISASVQDCDAIHLNRFYQEYESCLSMCRFFLEDSTLNQHQDQQRHFCFLLPMDSIFEGFVTGITQLYFSDRFKVEPQKAGCYLTDQEAFRIKNDMLLTNYDSKKQLIVDTKYKLRSKEKIDAKGGVNQSDLYQMVSYALRRNTDQVLLLYPNKYGQDWADNAYYTVSSQLLNVNPLHCRAISIEITGSDRQTMVQNVIAQLSKAYNTTLTSQG
jgi:5-methylcytosine-specific restriction enzyme subunit McrC